MVSILYNNIEGVFYDPKKETLGIFYDRRHSSFRGSPYCVFYQLISPLPPPPSQTRILDFEMLYGVKSNVSFSHLHWDNGHAYLMCTIWSGKKTTPWTTTTAFSLNFFFIILPLFVFFIRYCCSCYELRYLNKNRSDVKWLLFLIFSRILVQMNANKFSENSWEILGFSG